MTAAEYAVVLVGGMLALLNIILRRQVGKAIWTALGVLLVAGGWEQSSFVRRYAFWSIAVCSPIVLVAIYVIVAK